MAARQACTGSGTRVAPSTIVWRSAWDDGSRSPTFRSAADVEAFLRDYTGPPPARTVRTRGDSSEQEIEHRDELREAQDGD